MLHPPTQEAGVCQPGMGEKTVGASPVQLLCWRTRYLAGSQVTHVRMSKVGFVRIPGILLYLSKDSSRNLGARNPSSTLGREYLWVEGGKWVS
uniref:Uncharacterized protein n=1 Tax=Pelusios castaneus TaxID=367368 RepID=A0A8C8SMJ9_9SAUR